MKDKDIDIDLTSMDDAAAKEVVRKSLLLIDDEHKAGEIDDDVYSLTRQRYLAYGKELLDGETEQPAKSVKTKVVTAKKSKRKTNRTIVISTIIVFFIVLAVIALAGNKSARTGSKPLSGGVAESNSDLLAEASSDQAKGDLSGALNLYDKVLTNDPNNIDALASRGWSLYLGAAAIANSQQTDVSDLVERSMNDLNKAVSMDPTYGPARAWRGIVRYRALGDAAGAVQDFDVYLSANRDDGLHDLVQQVRDQAAATAATTPTTSK